LITPELRAKTAKFIKAFRAGFFRLVRRLEFWRVLHRSWRVLFRLRVGRRRVRLVLLVACVATGFVIIWFVHSFVAFEEEQAIVKRVPVWEEKPAPTKEVVEKKKIPARPVKPVAPVLPKKRARIAIILDDAGGNYVNYADVYSIKGKFSISILPGLPYSARVMREAEAHGKEAMLHLPMEPFDSSYNRNNGMMVLTSMTSEEIGRVVMNCLNYVPDVRGINNHMGSRATSDRRVMELVLSEIEGKNLFFVDSRTSPTSVAFDVARAKGVASAKNDIFLDAVEGERAIEEKFALLVQIARGRGYAIAIGHITRPATISVLKRLMPKYEEEGIEFVGASSLVN